MCTYSRAALQLSQRTEDLRRLQDLFHRVLVSELRVGVVLAVLVILPRNFGELFLRSAVLLHVFNASVTEHLRSKRSLIEYYVRYAFGLAYQHGIILSNLCLSTHFYARSYGTIKLFTYLGNTALVVHNLKVLAQGVGTISKLSSQRTTLHLKVSIALEQK